MRSLFLVILLANVGVLAYGQGFFGPPPSEQGRQPRQLSQRNQFSITLKAPLPPAQTPSAQAPASPSQAAPGRTP